MRKCAHCGNPVPLRSSGPQGTYCSSRCRTAAHRKRVGGWGVVPAEMRAVRRWVNREGKVPMQVRGGHASSTRPDTWSSMGETSPSGRGFMLGGGFACIDIDHCLDDRGRPDARAEVILGAFPGAFVEVSQSGTGLHVFGTADPAPGVSCGDFEFYTRDRFIAMTGKVFRRGGLVPLSVEEIVL